MSSDAALIVIAAGYGITMKVADLMNEHGLKWFRGSPLLFGLLWGVCGVGLVYGNPTVANLILAMNLAFLMRNRLDYLNHQLAAVMIVVAFTAGTDLQPLFFVVMFATFLLFGALKDYLGDVIHRQDWLGQLAEAGLYYPIPALVYCWLAGNWVVFGVSLAYVIAYDLTKLIAARFNYR